MGYGKRKMRDGEKKMMKTITSNDPSIVRGNKTVTNMPSSEEGEKKEGEKKMKKTVTKMESGGKMDFGILDAKARARSAFSCGK